MLHNISQITNHYPYLHAKAKTKNKTKQNNNKKQTYKQTKKQKKAHFSYEISRSHFNNIHSLRRTQ